MNFKFYFLVEHGVRSYLQTMLPLVELKISLLFFDCILMGSKYFDNFVYVLDMFPLMPMNNVHGTRNYLAISHHRPCFFL